MKPYKNTVTSLVMYLTKQFGLVCHVSENNHWQLEKKESHMIVVAMVIC